MNTTAKTATTATPTAADSGTLVTFESLRDNQKEWATIIGKTYADAPVEFKIGDVVMAKFTLIRHGHEPLEMTTPAVVIRVEFASEISEDNNRIIVYGVQPLDFMPGSSCQVYDDDLPEEEASPEDMTLIARLEDYTDSDSTSVLLSDPEWEVIIQQLAELNLNPASEVGEVLDQLRMQTGIGVEDVTYLSEEGENDE